MKLASKNINIVLYFFLIVGIIGSYTTANTLFKYIANRLESKEISSDEQTKEYIYFLINNIEHSNVAVVPQQISSLISYFGKISLENGSSTLFSSTSKHQLNLYIYHFSFLTKIFIPIVLSFIDFKNFRS